VINWEISVQRTNTLFVDGCAEMKELFLLDENVVFLNHGSFGATPKTILAAYQDWQRRMERQPVKFLGREIGAYLAEARQILGAFVNADMDDLVFIPNATFGVNVVARSLDLGPGDEVLSTNHEYGACENIWSYLSQKRGFGFVQQDIPLPFADEKTIVEQMWAGVTDKTRVIFMSHITSPTALCLPVKAICRRARQAGILTVIDGAHTVGQISLDLKALGADFYTSNGHKWLCSPKGSAFLYARREMQGLIEPLVVGWGWGANAEFSFGSSYLNNLQWLGTNDLSAYLTVPAAIAFQEKHDWPAVRQRSHVLLMQAIERIRTLTGLPAVYDSDDGFRQMAIAPLPPIADIRAFKAHLYDAFRVEIPLIEWGRRPFIRISVQGYNDQSDMDLLVGALKEMLSL
jgi:isopenicillin-N epimerase